MINEKKSTKYPFEETGIKIGQKADAIHFLASCRWGREKRGTEVASFVMHYKDGSSETRQVKFFDDIADWLAEPTDNPFDAAQIGWQVTDKNGKYMNLSELVWKNPHPDKTIQTIDFISAKAKAAPFLVGITLE